MHVRPGYITFTLSSLLGVSLLGAALHPVLAPTQGGQQGISYTSATLKLTASPDDQARYQRFALQNWHDQKLVTRRKRPRRQPVAQPAAVVQAPVAQPPPAGPGVLTAAQVGQLWLNARGPASQEGIAECVAYAESQDNPGALNPDDDYGMQTSVGLFQLSTGSHSYPGSWLTAAGNAAGAVAKYDASGWSPWPTAWGCGA